MRRGMLAVGLALSAAAALCPMAASANACGVTSAGVNCNIDGVWYRQATRQPAANERISFDLAHLSDLFVADVPVVPFQDASARLVSQTLLAALPAMLYSPLGTRSNESPAGEFDSQAQAPIPEPGTGALLLAGLLGMFGVMRRRVFGS